MLTFPAGGPRGLSMVVFVVGALVLWILWASVQLNLGSRASGGLARSSDNRLRSVSTAEADLIELAAQHFNDFPIQPPYEARFGELGGRLRILRQWIELADGTVPGQEQQQVQNATEAVTGSIFPFLRKNKTTATPFSDLRRSFTGERGIVIPTGSGTFRFACHSIVGLRRVLQTQLPIQIVYAGDDDLPADKRDALATLGEDSGVGKIEFLNILDVLDDETLQLASGGWAIKAFAVLASRFKQVILLDADAVFLQSPEALFAQKQYMDNGVLLFHDRKLWQHGFKERHEWWHAQVIHPGPQLNKSLVWTEEFAEEGDSGVVVVDKSRLDVLLGLLHVAWQNTHAVREEVTYRMTYGDKESWWFGFELAGSTYAFEAHYGGIVGWQPGQIDSGEQKVCSFVIAHVDEHDRLLWYNGGLLKNKMTDPTTFEVPTHWTMDGEWVKGARKEDMSCMRDSLVRELTDQEKDVLQRSMDMAKSVDSELGLVELI
ncbi:Glycosyl transferase [Pleurostoma richardsiae]|uniref:Glycosyl transferase n=1 Tax=Pleurostoma richardsiae TaxID=41990 RepID=A0AA38RLJ8_9PEZI|nr:Glycosyl transferase [Pleurostoma richardsiae]